MNKNIVRNRMLGIIGMAAVPVLFIRAVVYSVAPVLIITYSILAVFLEFPVIMSIGSHALNIYSQLLFAFVTVPIMMIFSVLSWKALKLIFSLALKKDKPKPFSAGRPSIVSLVRVQSFTIIKTVTITIPLIFLLLLVGLVVFFIADTLLFNSYFVNILMQKLLFHGYVTSLFIPYLGTYSRLVVAGLTLTLLCVALKGIAKKISKKSARQIIKAVIHTGYLTLMLLILVNLVFLYYTDNVFTIDNDSVESTSYLQKVEGIKKQVSNKISGASLSLDLIIGDIMEDSDCFYSLTYHQRLDICREINDLMDLKGGPDNRAEHYFRNHLNQAPATLEEMIKEIHSPTGSKWILMEPSQSIYHMFGKDGEFNLKFISEDGFFEAVYNKEGALLTEKNDPVNMGTYNYANPVENPEKHAVCDVLPYYLWGNTVFSKSCDEEDALDNLDKYYANEAAIAYRDTIQAALSLE